MLEPNYSEYSLDELIDTLNVMDKEAFPERAAKIRQELEIRESSTSTNPKESASSFDYNEQFYACPNCEGKIGILSKAINSMSKIKTCPHCSKPFGITTNFKFLAYIFMPAILINYFLLKPLLVAFGISSSISLAIVTISILILSIRLTKVNKSTEV